MQTSRKNTMNQLDTSKVDLDLLANVIEQTEDQPTLVPTQDEPQTNQYTSSGSYLWLNA